jgi:hypothetical protein
MNQSDMNVPRDRASEIESEISSDQSPVGIDAKKTHVIILHLLLNIQERLARLEERLDSGDR